MAGASGRIRVEIVNIRGRYIICFWVLNCHFIFILFDVGNMVSDVVYVIRV